MSAWNVHKEPIVRDVKSGAKRQKATIRILEALPGATWPEMKHYHAKKMYFKLHEVPQIQEIEYRAAGAERGRESGWKYLT